MKKNGNYFTFNDVSLSILLVFNCK